MGGHRCFLKDATSAKCRHGCVPGKDGWCTELVHTKPVHQMGLRFFCFSFYTQNTGSTKQSHELELLKTQLSLGASLFGCPSWKVYSDVQVQLSSDRTTTKLDDVDGNFHLFKRKKAGTWVNAMMFYQAWLDIRNNQLTADSDWVIKVDADAVFLPSRLSSRTWRIARPPLIGRGRTLNGSGALTERI